MPVPLPGSGRLPSLMPPGEMVTTRTAVPARLHDVTPAPLPGVRLVVKPSAARRCSLALHWPDRRFHPGVPPPQLQRARARSAQVFMVQAWCRREAYLSLWPQGTDCYGLQPNSAHLNWPLLILLSGPANQDCSLSLQFAAPMSAPLSCNVLQIRRALRTLHASGKKCCHHASSRISFPWPFQIPTDPPDPRLRVGVWGSFDLRGNASLQLLTSPSATDESACTKG